MLRAPAVEAQQGGGWVAALRCCLRIVARRSLRKRTLPVQYKAAASHVACTTQHKLTCKLYVRSPHPPSSQASSSMAAEHQQLSDDAEYDFEDKIGVEKDLTVRCGRQHGQACKVRLGGAARALPEAAAAAADPAAASSCAAWHKRAGVPTSLQASSVAGSAASAPADPLAPLVCTRRAAPRRAMAAARRPSCARARAGRRLRRATRCQVGKMAAAQAGSARAGSPPPRSCCCTRCSAQPCC